MRSPFCRTGLVVVAGWMLFACSPQDPYVPRPLEAYWPTQGWRSADPRDAGLDIRQIRSLIDYIRDGDQGVDSLSIVRHGYLVVDAYFNSFHKGQRHIVYSCTKSVVSTLIGIALSEGYISGLDDKMLALFQGRNIQNLDADKQAIDLEDLLTMQAGLDARDSYLYNWVGLEAMHASGDAVQYVLDLPMAEPPGVRFEYTNGVSHLLSALILEKTGRSTLQYAKESLFEPLGITEVEWSADEQGVNWGYSHLYLTPHDMAKLGYLFLRGGLWEDAQIVPGDWIEAATTRHTAGTLVDGYGYQWWVDNTGYYLALGYKGQFVIVLPRQDMVVVFTGSEPGAFDFALSLIESRILPAASW